MHYFLTDMILDLLQNSVEAGSEEIELHIWHLDQRLHFGLSDNGCGMDEAQLERAKDPFYSDGEKHAGRRVGLGLPFVIQTAQQCGGEFSIESRAGQGTCLSCSFDLSNVDTPPVGDWPSLFLQALNFPGPYNLKVRKDFGAGGSEDAYSFERRELLEALGDFSNAQNLLLLREFLRSQEADVSLIESEINGER